MERDEASVEAIALLKLLAMGNRQVAEGQLEPFDSVIDELRADLKAGRLNVADNR